EVSVLRGVVEGIQVSDGVLEGAFFCRRTAGIGNRKDRAPVWRRHAGAADFNPLREAEGVIHRNARARIGIGRNIGNTAHSSAAASREDAVLIRLAGLNRADSAAAAAPRRLMAIVRQQWTGKRKS